MTAYPWPALDNARGRALRLRAVRHLAPVGLAGLAAGTALVAPASSLETWAALTAVLALSYAALDAPAAARSGRAAHQREVLPLLWRAEGVEVHAHPHAEPPWVLLARSGLMPSAGAVVRPLGARPGAVLVGMVDGCPLEASEVVLTREKIVRKVRKIQVPYARAAAVVVDLGPQAAFAPAWAVGLRALSRAPTTGRARRVRGPGMAWGGKAWSALSGTPAWTGAAWEALADLLRHHPRASVALPDGRHLVVVLAKGDKLFHPVSLWLPVARDARAAQAVALMRSTARLARALGAGGAAGVGGAAAPHVPSSGPGAPVPAVARPSPFGPVAGAGTDVPSMEKTGLTSGGVAAPLAPTPSPLSAATGEPIPAARPVEPGLLPALRAGLMGKGAHPWAWITGGPALMGKAALPFGGWFAALRERFGRDDGTVAPPTVRVLDGMGQTMAAPPYSSLHRPSVEGVVPPAPGSAIPFEVPVVAPSLPPRPPGSAAPTSPVVPAPVIQAPSTAGNPRAGLPTAGTPVDGAVVVEPFVSPVHVATPVQAPVLGPAGVPLGAPEVPRAKAPRARRREEGGAVRAEPTVRAPKARTNNRPAAGPSPFSTGPAGPEEA